jgi:hypothetical protein
MKRNFFTSNRWFCCCFSLPRFCLLVFTKPFGGTNPATIDWSQIPVGILLKNLFEMDFLTAGSFMPWIAAFLIRFDYYYSLTKVFRENRSSAGRFQVYWRWGKAGAFSFFQHHCVQFGLIQRVRVAKHWAWKVHTKPNHRCFNHATIQHPVLVQPVIWLYQKAILQNLEFIADSEALLKISDKSVSNHAFKITAHENCVALSNHFINH